MNVTAAEEASAMASPLDSLREPKLHRTGCHGTVSVMSLNVGTTTSPHLTIQQFNGPKDGKER